MTIGTGPRLLAREASGREMVAPDKWARDRISFRAVNQRGRIDHDPGLQRHHLLPRQLLGKQCFGQMFDAMGRHSVGFDDFRKNGLLLPAREQAAIRMGLPMHRGPHRTYNAMVIERVGQIEATWSSMRLTRSCTALEQALMRMRLLQRALRRRLLKPTGNSFLLSGKDPRRPMPDFSDLDAMADLLWADIGGST